MGYSEALSDCVFDGWDADGQPVGRPWNARLRPTVAFAAVSEDQTANMWDPVLVMADSPGLADYGLDAMQSKVVLPFGQMVRVTSSAETQKGKPNIVLALLDQTEEWVPSRNGPGLAQTLRTNASKVGGRTIESPNAFIPGRGSVAEMSADYADKIARGVVKRSTLLYDMREGPADTDMADHASLYHGLRVAYGDSSADPRGCVIHDPPCPPGWVDLEAQIDIIWDTATDPQQARADYLNQITRASDSWMSRQEWNSRSLLTLEEAAKVDPTVKIPTRLAKGDVITLGFDGSRRRSRGVTDATALVACRVSDGYVEPIRIWEQPDGPAGEEWRVPVDEVMSEVARCFREFKVVGFFADPAKWEGNVAQWEGQYGTKLLVKATRSNPIEFWINGTSQSKVYGALESFKSAVLEGDLTQSGDATLTRHILNSRMRTNRTGYSIYKAYPDSWDKIDGAWGAVLAWAARMEAVSSGHQKGSHTPGHGRWGYSA
ncbi:MAG: hypothetical protein FWF25_02775 [Propionibacteriaceae bacterium]|nr:hypothetical protein [Propionibacteriaceae bacterium]